jgi:hypothetical protein
LTDVEAFVLARSVSGTLRAVQLHDEALLKNLELENALVALIIGFLNSRTHQ